MTSVLISVSYSLYIQRALTTTARIILEAKDAAQIRGGQIDSEANDVQTYWTCSFFLLRLFYSTMLTGEVMLHGMQYVIAFGRKQQTNKQTNSMV
jgi:hypothetical protein